MATDNYSVLVDHDRHPPTELSDGCRNFIDSLRRDLPCILGIRYDLTDWPSCNSHLPSDLCVIDPLGLLNCWAIEATNIDLVTARPRGAHSTSPPRLYPVALLSGYKS